MEDSIHITCAISGQNCAESACRKFKYIDGSIQQLIKVDFPEIKEDQFVSLKELIKYRKKYLAKIIETEEGSIDELQRNVLEAVSKNKILSENIEDNLEDNLTFGQRIADKIAEFGGSWYFIISFFAFIVIWILYNISFPHNSGFDPYPFILLNLLLSCLAAIQAPIIMMSQNRQEQKDRLRSEHDYKINLKAELEIQLLHEKIDHLMLDQNKKLLEIQQLQVDYFEDIVKQLSGKTSD